MSDVSNSAAAATKMKERINVGVEQQHSCTLKTPHLITLTTPNQELRET
ncbi:unnamed protein product [Larinioides sclopetarius]|uniref:Uncharacterized protein n=1 Tax=Larinioides sclopetarius TaxID=280406 RepID=A0AAV1ZKG9_9ARAC